MIVYPGITEKYVEDVFKRIKLFVNNVDGFHFDFADGKYVPNKLVSIDDLEKLPDMFFEAHLMVNNPENYFDKCQTLGFKRIIVHFETLKELSLEYVTELKLNLQKKNIELGLAFKKGVKLPNNILNIVDYALVMMIEPGFSGQPFLSEQLDMIKSIREINSKIKIGADGHIDEITGPEVCEAGAKVLVSTSYLTGIDFDEKYMILKGI